jgi:hypothetical protein
MRVRRHRSLRIGLGSLASLVLVAGLSLGTPAVVLGSDGFTEKATTTYVVNPEEQRLDVTLDLTFKNTKRPTSTTIYYYNSDYIWLEKDAKNVRGTSSGATITITKQQTSGQYTEYRVRWSPVLFYNKTRTVHITYQIPTGAPRSTSWFRISPAYLDFCVIGTGLDGGSTTIKVPLSYSMSVDSEENGRLGSTIDGTTRIYTTGTLDNAFEFWACLTGEQPAAFTSTKVTAPSGREIDIQAWPGDTTWTADLQTQLGSVLTELEALTGQGLPGDGPIAIREVGAGTLGQYAGFFDPDTGVARIGEDLEAKGLITHELAHAWFNGDLFQPHWLSEGYAEWARTSIDGDTCPAPLFPGSGSPNLEAWQFAGPRATDEDLDIIDYQYAAACALILQVAARIGDDGMRTVLDALINHDLAYRSGGATLKGPTAAASWQTWLDAVDELGLASDNTATEVATIASLLLPYGITKFTGGASLQDRANARRDFHALVAAIGEWRIPAFVLQAMGSWHFDTATAAMATIDDVYETSARISTVLDGVDGSSGKARTLVEAAAKQADLDAALAAANDRLDAAGTVAAARDALAAPRDLVMQAGLLGADLQPTLDAAIEAIEDDDPATARSGAQAIQAALADAPQQGQLRLMLGIGIPLLLLLLVAFVLFRRRRRSAALRGPGVTTLELAALDAALAPPPAIDAPPPAIDAALPAGIDPSPPAATLAPVEGPPAVDAPASPEGPTGERPPPA